jgi:hypothetical protein
VRTKSSAELNVMSDAMSDDEFAALFGAGDDALRQSLPHAQACLDLFEKDSGRRATTMFDIRNWADLQDPESLRFRIERRVRTEEAWSNACRSIWHDIPAPLAARPPLGQRISLTLAEAAAAAGLSEAAILAAIAGGRLAGMQDMEDGWHVDRAQLGHVFPAARAAAASEPASERPLDAATLVLEVGIQSLVRQAGDSLRQPRAWWRKRTG